MRVPSFASRLRELREQKGWTQKELATKAGLSAGAVRDLEQGLNGPTWETVAALADALGVSCEAFRQEPASASDKRGPGRPSKHAVSEGQAAEEAKEEAPRRKRGRPRKAQEG